MVVLGMMVARCAMEGPAIEPIDEKTLREYAGVYQWEPDAFLYLQIWSELTGTDQLVALDESGEVRTLYPTDPDRFFAGPGAAISASIESRIEFQRDRDGTITSLTWQREGAPTAIRARLLHDHPGVARGADPGVRCAGARVVAGLLITPTLNVVSSAAGAHAELGGLRAVSAVGKR